MPKKYEYIIFLANQRTLSQNNRRIIKSFDHSICNDDLIAIETEIYVETRPHVVWKVTSYSLQKVTGTFTYRFLVTFIDKKTQIILAINNTLNHQITTATIDKDYENIKQMVINSAIPGMNPDTFMVLLHQEIPDE